MEITNEQKQYLLNHGVPADRIDQILATLSKLKAKTEVMVTKNEAEPQRPFWREWTDGKPTRREEFVKAAKAAQVNNAIGWRLPIFETEPSEEKQAQRPNTLAQMIVENVLQKQADRKTDQEKRTAQELFFQQWIGE